MEDLSEKFVRLNFLRDLPLYQTTKPFKLMHPNLISTNFASTNMELETRDNIAIKDVRGCQDRFNLGDDGFCWFQQQSEGLQGLESEEGMRVYINKKLELLQTMFIDARIICYDFRLRLNVKMDYKELASTSRQDPAPPVSEVHVDHSNVGGKSRARRHLTVEEGEEYIDSGRYRIRIINLWQPRNSTIEDCPLVLCHPRSLDIHDLVSTDRVAPEFAGELWHPKYNPSQQWYWLSKQRCDEICAFVTYDSQSSVTGQVMAVAHSAFVDPSTSKDAPSRKSVEIRVLVIQPLHDN